MSQKIGAAPTIDETAILAAAAGAVKVRTDAATNAMRLLDEGATVPFIARYRKEMTGGMDEEQLRQLEKRVTYGRQLAGRKVEVHAAITEQGKMTADLAALISRAASLQEIDDLYLPYRPKRRTRATIAREKGLEPLAEMMLAQKTTRGTPAEIAARYVNPDKGVANADDALAGARDIVAERVSDDAHVRRRVREVLARQGVVSATRTKNGQDEGGTFQQYYDYAEHVARIPPHRVLALNRGEKEGVLAVGIELVAAVTEGIVTQLYVTDSRSIFVAEMRSAIADSVKRLLLPSLETAVRNDLTEHAETHAISLFAANVRQLLLQPPIQGKVVLGIDPGFRSGCKVAVVDPTGKPVANLAIFPHQPRQDWAGSKKTLLDLIKRFGVSVIAIGNGTASRETESLVAEVIRDSPDPKPAYVMVSEAGASVYSASDIARKEFPDLDATQRGNISIARRLQDPLAELVKIDPKSIGVGLYQHDVNQKALAESLDGVVESCVNYVGVDLNTASSSLLRHVSGINAKVADAIVVYRDGNGSFGSRAALRKVPGLGDKTFEQAAGFLKIPGAKTALDNTFIHPESYPAAQKLVALVTGGGSTILPTAQQVRAFRQANDTHLGNVAASIGVGEPTLRDMLDDLEKPGRDPRADMPTPILRHDVLKMEDLAPGMVLQGTVRNVVDFGAFVDIGVKQDGLVHVTEMRERFVQNPLDVVSVGDIISVRVLNVDKARGRVSLSMKL